MKLYTSVYAFASLSGYVPPKFKSVYESCVVYSTDRLLTLIC